VNNQQMFAGQLGTVRFCPLFIYRVRFYNRFCDRHKFNKLGSAVALPSLYIVNKNHIFTKLRRGYIPKLTYRLL